MNSREILNSISFDKHSKSSEALPGSVLDVNGNFRHMLLDIFVLQLAALSLKMQENRIPLQTIKIWKGIFPMCERTGRY
jgi:hypothetical protein